jgi:uncharacterized protein (TIGR03118 family)
MSAVRQRCGACCSGGEGYFLALLVLTAACASSAGVESNVSSDAGKIADASLAADGGTTVTADGGITDAGPGVIPQVYQVDYLGSDGTPPAVTTDTGLIGSWALSLEPTSSLWVTGRSGGVARAFDPTGMPLTDDIAMAKNASNQHPTGIVFNGERSFLGDQVIIATDEGVIEGWSAGGTATIRIDQSLSGAHYKALAIARTVSGDRLYATNFSGGVVEVFNGAYSPAFTFTDTSLPAGYAPLNIAAIDGSLFVTFAKKDSLGTSAATGAGTGYIDEFDTTGKLVRQVLAGGVLNAPFGIVHAPRDFGRFSDLLLVANLGDNRIHAFDPTRGDLLGQLEVPGYQPLIIDGLHDLKFGNDNAGGPHNVLYFTAAPNAGANGAFGSITPTN